MISLHMGTAVGILAIVAILTILYYLANDCREHCNVLGSSDNRLVFN